MAAIVSEKMLEALNDEAFAKRIEKIESEEEMVKAFAEKGIDLKEEKLTLTDEDLERYFEENVEEMELSEEDLLDVAAGIRKTCKTCGYTKDFPWYQFYKNLQNAHNKTNVIWYGYFVSNKKSDHKQYEAFGGKY